MLLRPLMKLAEVMAADRSHPSAGVLLACLLAILRLMCDNHYNAYVARFTSHNELALFISDVLSIFSELITKPAFPSVCRG
jgi:hypothetical protein